MPMNTELLKSETDLLSYSFGLGINKYDKDS